MKYMLLIYNEEKAKRTEKDREDCKNEAVKLAEQLRLKGQYVAANPLHPVATAKSVRVHDGKRLVTDGPFAETHEQLGGSPREVNERNAKASRRPSRRST